MKSIIYLLVSMVVLVFLSACGGGGSDGGGDTTPPRIISSYPVSNTPSISVLVAPTVTFSEAMDAATINTASFTLSTSGLNVAGSVSYDNSTHIATFTPAAALAYNTEYTATVTTAAKDVAGNAMVALQAWNFTTAALPDTTPPTVTSSNPIDAAVDVATGVTPSVTFSEAMDAASINAASFTLVDAGANAVTGTVAYDGNTFTATFTSSAVLKYNTTYTATITNAVTDTSANPLAANYTWSFTTLAASDTTPPQVSTTNPLKRAKGALLSGPITATFSEALDPATVTVSSFLVTGPAGAVSGMVTLTPDGLTAQFTPQTPFTYTTRYDVQLTTAIRDLAGNHLAADYTWFFNTGKRLSAGRAHMCARLDDGGVKCWGGGFDGQLGLGDTLTRGDEPNEMGANLPRVNLGTNRKVVQVVSGNWHNCARLDDGSVKCWGANLGGVLGLGDVVTRGKNINDMGDNLPTVDLGTNRTAIQLSAGGWHTCAILDNGSVKCWGDNTNSQLGLGDTNDRGDEPGEMGDALPTVDLGSGRTARELAASLFHTCARLDNGSVKCWGSNNSGQLGLGDTNSRGDAPGEMGDNLPAVDLGTGRTAVGIETNGDHTCARLDNDTLKCWGYNIVGQLGLGGTNTLGDDPGEMGDNLPAVDLGTGRTAAGLAIGYWHSCARLDNGSLKCWGFNAYGQLGLEDRDNRGDNASEMGDYLPAVNLGTGRTVKEMASKFNDTCARLDDDSVKCWGSNYSGQLGLGDTSARGDDVGEMGDNLPVVDIGN